MGAVAQTVNQQFPLPNGSAFAETDDQGNMTSDEFTGKYTMLDGTKLNLVVSKGPRKGRKKDQPTLRVELIDDEGEPFAEALLTRVYSDTPKAPLYRGQLNGVHVAAFLNEAKTTHRHFWSIAKDQRMEDMPPFQLDSSWY